MDVSPFRAPFLLRSRLALAFFLFATFAALLCCANGVAQGIPANYTDDMPTMAQVQAKIQGTDATDTLERQVAVFQYLQTYLRSIKEGRDYRGPFTAAETKLLTDYSKAPYDMTQNYTKTHTPQEVTAFNLKVGQYSLNNALEWIHQLQGPKAAAAENANNASLHASAKKMYDQQMQNLQQAQQAQQQAGSGQMGMVNGQPMAMSNDPTSVATRRCLELGGDNLACVGKGLMGGMIDMVTGPGGMDAITGPGPTGVVLSGNYDGRTGSSVGFGGNSGTLYHCGKLADDSYNYTLNKTATALKVTLATSPNPLVLTMRSDGSLAGPGLVTINGRIITGYEIITHYKNGYPNGQDRIPQYAPATDRCTVGVLAAPPPPAPASASTKNSSEAGGLLGSLLNTVASVAPPSLPGLRMSGKYTSNGLQFDFAGDSVTLDCGAAHVKAPYTVENAPSSLLVHVKNSGGPFDLVVSSDNTLRGSGSTTINGRLVTGMDGDNVTFAPHAETCQLATYTPQIGAGSTTTVAANASPAPAPSVAAASAAVATSPAPVSALTSTTGPMKLAVTSSFPIAKNPLAGAVVKLMTDRIDNVLRKAGAPLPAGATPGQALKAYVQNCPPPTGCPAMAQVMKPSYVGTATFDTNGSATISSSVPPGNYYVVCSAAGTSGALVWDLPVTLKSGQNNSIQLTATNAELVK